VAVFRPTLREKEVPGPAPSVEMRPFGPAAARACADVAGPLEDGAGPGIDHGKRDAGAAVRRVVRAEIDGPVVVEKKRGVDAAHRERKGIRPGTLDRRRGQEEIAQPVYFGASQPETARAMAERRGIEPPRGRRARQVELRGTAQGRADGLPIHQVMRPPERQAGKEMEARGREVETVADPADARVGVEAGQDGIAPAHDGVFTP